MPALLAIPWLVPLITGVAAAGSLAATGYTLANEPSSSSSSSSATAAEAQAKQQAAAQSAAQKTAFLAAQPNVQAQTGGSLTSTGFNTASATQAGVPSDLNSIAQYLGLSTGTGSATAAPVSGGITTTPGANNQQTQSQPLDLDALSTLLRQAA
jgi:hypothetical protein